MLRIIIADNNISVRQGLKQLLEDEYQALTVAEVADGSGLMERVQHEHWDVIILDINMPPGNGLKALQDLRSSAIPTPVLIISFHKKEQYAARLLRQGAAGYIEKDNAVNELAIAVRQVLEGKKYVSAL